MSYLENLKKFKKTNLKIWEILCADEVSCVFEIVDETNELSSKLSASDAETIIGFVYEWVMDEDASPNELCVIIKNAFILGDLHVSDFTNDIEKCTNYINSSF